MNIKEVTTNIKRIKAFFAENPESSIYVREMLCYLTKREFYNWLEGRINARINRNEPPLRGRKDSEMFFYGLKRLSNDFKHRVIVREQSTNWLLNAEPKIKARIQHRLYTNEDL